MIHLKCPRGHALTAPDDKAGKSGKCPECGTRFRVPAPGESQTTVESTSSGSGSELQRAEPAANLERPIVFLCPNGHRLNGPARLAGKPGQCPHCQEKFLIPTLEELREYEQQAVEENGVASDDPEENLEEIEELDESNLVASGETSIGFGQSDVRLAEESRLVGEPAVRSAVGAHLAGVFQHLWSLKKKDQSLEITLKSGQTLVAERFSPGDGAAAVIAARQENGKLTVTAVAWDAVATVNLKDVEKLPGDLFRE